MASPGISHAIAQVRGNCVSVVASLAIEPRNAPTAAAAI